MHGCHPLRFSVERLPDGRHLVADWKYGTLGAPGKGTAAEAEELRSLARVAVKVHGDVNILRMKRNPMTPPRWPGGIPPEPREYWQREQREIAEAYSAVGTLLRLRRMDAEKALTDPEVVIALRNADRLHLAALVRIGLLPKN